MGLSDSLSVEFKPSTTLLDASETPVLHATLKNTASHPITALRYNCILDDAAGVLGIFTVTNASNGGEVPSDVIRFQRVWPPAKNALLEIVPGKEIEFDIALRTHKLDPNSKYNVVARWEWQGLWKDDAETVMEAYTKEGEAAAESGEHGEVVIAISDAFKTRGNGEASAGEAGLQTSLY